MENILSRLVNDHVAVEPATLEGRSEDRRYSVVHRADPTARKVPDISHADLAGSVAELGAAYHSAPGVTKVMWGSSEVLGRDLEHSDALRVAREYASGNNLPVYMRVD